MGVLASEAGVTGWNPSSQHSEGRAARARLEAARREIAAAAGAAPGSVVLTSGATEGANTVLRAAARPDGGAEPWDVLLISAIEHDCVRGAAAAAAEAGARLAEIPANADGLVEPAAVAAALAAHPGRRRLVAVMAANNETGVIQPVEEIVRLAREAGAQSLVDSAQAFGKIPYAFDALGADFALLSGHKIGGPAGTGAILVREGAALAPALLGGGQELRRRAGTENLIGIVGFAAAAASVDPDSWTAAASARDRFENLLKFAAQGLVFFGDEVHRLPNTSCVAATDWRAERQLMGLDLAGFAVSAGSACSSGKMAASHVLLAMGADPDLAASAIRVSFGPDASAGDAEALAASWLELWERRRRAAAPG